MVYPKQIQLRNAYWATWQKISPLLYIQAWSNGWLFGNYRFSIGCNQCNITGTELISSIDLIYHPYLLELTEKVIIDRMYFCHHLDFLKDQKPYEFVGLWKTEAHRINIKTQPYDFYLYDGSPSFSHGQVITLERLQQPHEVVVCTVQEHPLPLLVKSTEGTYYSLDWRSKATAYILRKTSC